MSTSMRPDAPSHCHRFQVELESLMSLKSTSENTVPTSTRSHMASITTHLASKRANESVQPLVVAAHCRRLRCRAAVAIRASAASITAQPRTVGAWLHYEHVALPCVVRLRVSLSPSRSSSSAATSAAASCQRHQPPLFASSRRVLCARSASSASSASRCSLHASPPRMV